MSESSRRVFKGHDVFICPGLPEKGRAILYAPTLKQLIEIRETLAQRLLTCHGKAFGENLEILNPYLYDIFINALKSAICLKEPQQKTTNIFPLSVGLTRDCSLRCIYCHAEAGEKNTEIDPEILTAALQYASHEIKRKGLKGLHVSFAVGGEPTYNWEVFCRFVDMVNECASTLNVKLLKSITTNGFYSDRARKFLSSQFDSILLSFDGPKEIQNIHRPTKSGQGSYYVVLESARYFAENAKSFSVRATISSLSGVHPSNWTRWSRN